MSEQFFAIFIRAYPIIGRTPGSRTPIGCNTTEKEFDGGKIISRARPLS